MEMSIIENYIIIKPLNDYYSDIYLVSHKDTDKIYILKKVKNQNEITINSIVSHPNIAKMYRHFDDNAIFEYCENGDLLDYHNQNRMTEYKIKMILRKLIPTIMYLHSIDIVHRDLKLENILLDRHYNIKLCDFEFAEQGEYFDTIGGTVDYHSPEMLTHPKYGKSVDIWSIGILTYELLYSLPPFRGKNYEETVQNVLNLNYKLTDKRSKEAQDFISQILVLDPEKRLTLEQMLKHPFLA
jgi:aurora kinase